MESILKAIGALVIVALLLGCGFVVSGIVNYAERVNTVPGLLEGMVVTLDANSPPVLPEIVVTVIRETAVPSAAIPTVPPAPTIDFAATTDAFMATLEAKPEATPFPPMTSLPLNGPYSPEQVELCRAHKERDVEYRIFSPQFENCEYALGGQ